MSNPETPRPYNKEREELQEILVPDFDWIAIYGPSGTGKTTVGKILRNLYNIPFYKPSTARRKTYELKTGRKIVDFDERTPLEDFLFDENTRETMLARISDPTKPSRKRPKPMIVEARLGGWITTQIEEQAEVSGEPKPKAVRILMTAPLQTQAIRILNRTNKEIEKENETLPSAQRKKLLTYEDTLEQTRNRDARNNEAWHLAHYPMVGNPMDPDPKTTAQKHDLIVDTQKISALQCAALINNYLMENGYVRKISINDPEAKLSRLNPRRVKQQQRLMQKLSQT